MDKNRNAKLAHAAFEATEIAVDAYCKANNIHVMDLPDELLDSFLDVALRESFSPHTKMSEIFPGATDRTLGEMTRSD